MAGPSATHASTQVCRQMEPMNDHGLRIGWGTLSLSAVMAYNPAGLPPCPLVGASSFMRSTVRWRGM